VWAVPFDLAKGEVWVKALIHGPLGVRRVKCLFDTGTGITIVNTPVLDSLGFNAKMGKETKSVWGMGGGKLPGYTIDVHLEVFGLTLEPFEVLAQDILPDRFGVEVLIGMDFVPGRIMTLDGMKGLFSVGSGMPE